MNVVERTRFFAELHSYGVPPHCLLLKSRVNTHTSVESVAWVEASGWCVVGISTVSTQSDEVSQPSDVKG